MLERQVRALEVCHAKEILLYPTSNLRQFTEGQANSRCFVSNQYFGKR